jgi:hypothetical protein
MHSAILSLDLITASGPNLSFIRANKQILDRYSLEFERIIDVSQKEELLGHLWMKLYNARLVKDSNVYSKIQFNSKSSLSMFLLQWS